MRYIILLAATCWLAVAPAQIQRIVHQSFELSDSATVIELALRGDFRVEPWAGDNILVETQIRLFNASESILKEFLKTGRYELVGETGGGALRLTAKDQERRPIKTSKGECFEEVMQRLFLPEEYVPAGEHRWQRPLPKEATTPRDTTGKGK